MIRLIYYIQQAVYIGVPIICIALFITGHYHIANFLIIIIGILIWGVFYIRLSLFISTLNKIKTSEKIVALTFDDGIGELTKQVLTILEQENIKASFFVIGQNISSYPHILKQIHQNGHTIGLHTQSHKLNFPYMMLKKVKEEIQQNKNLINNTINIKPTLFRPPFGIMNPVIARAARELNLQVVGWSIRSLDTKITDEQKLIKRIIRLLKPGGIILLHDTMPITIAILPELIRQIKQNGYKFVTLPS